MSLRTGILLLLLLLTVQASQVRDSHSQDVPDIRDVKYRHFLEASRQIKHTTRNLDRHRTKRSTLYTTGVKVCPQDSMKDVISSHRAYYKLRICQEAVWEAFRIFLDRVPNTEEFKHWVSACHHGSICLDDMAHNFSSTQEHLDMVARRVAAEEQAEKDRGAIAGPEPGRPEGEKCLKPPALLMIPEDYEEATEGPNLVPEDPFEQVVEFSITIVEPGYSELLSDLETPQYHDVTQDLHHKMLHVFNKLPGFKEIRVLGFRSEDVSVRYAVVFDGDPDASAEAGVTLEPGAGPDVSALKDLVAKALREETSLPVDIHSLSFETDATADATVAPDEALGVTPLEILVSGGVGLLPGVVTLPLTTEVSVAEGVGSTEGLFPTLAEVVDNSLEALTTRPETYTYVPPILEELSEEVTASPAPDEAPPIQEAAEEVRSIEEEPPPMEEVAVDTPGEAIEVLLPVTTLAAITDRPPTEPIVSVGEEEIAAEEKIPPAEATLTEGPAAAEVAVEKEVVPTVTTLEVGSEEGDLPEAPAEPVEESLAQAESVEPLNTETRPIGAVQQPENDTPQAEEEAGPVEPEEEMAGEVPSLPGAPETGAAAPLPEKGEKEPDERTVTPTSPDLPRDQSMVKEDVAPSAQGGTQAGDIADANEGSGFPSGEKEGSYESTAPPALRQISTPLVTTLDKGKELVVFFSLRVTNMMFSEDLFNKSSPEYRSLENTFLELTQFSASRNSPNPGASSRSGTRTQRTLASIPLLPYLQSNLTGFKELEILNFRNGSVVVNSKMKLDKPVPYNVTEAVHCVLEEFCNAASKRLDIEIDSRSLDVEPADQGDPCRFLACSEFSRCVVSSWGGEARCVCEPGYSAADSLPCQSVCTLEPDYCLNGGLCEIIQGHGVTCRCPVGKYWHYHGERCSELVSLPLDPAVIFAGLVGSLSLVCAVIAVLIYINKRCVRTRKTVTLVHTLVPYAFENTMRVNPVFESDEDVLTQVSTMQCPSSAGLSQPPDQSTFPSIENIHLSIEMPRQLHTTRCEKLVSEMVCFHHGIPLNETWRPQHEDNTYYLLRPSDNEVTVL